MYEDRFPVVEAYLYQAFPGATIERRYREGDPFIERRTPHAWDAELWRIRTSERDYDLGIKDDALHDITAEALTTFLPYNSVGTRLAECAPKVRLWIITPALMTDAPLDESP